MQNKKLNVAAFFSLLVILSGVFDQTIHVGFQNGLRQLFSIIPLGLVVGAFAFDKAGKRGGAIVCAVLCIIDAIWWKFIRRYAVFGQPMEISGILNAIGYTIPDILLLMFVISKKRSQKVWMILGVLLTISTFCCDCYLPVLWLIWDMGFSSVMRRVLYLVIRFICGIPFGLIYLFGFMSASQVQKETTYSYLEQYKREHGMK